MIRLVDKELVLRSHVSTPITSTTAEVGKLLYPRNHHVYTAVVDIGAIDRANLDETYQITIETSDSLAGAYVTLATLSSGVIVGGGNNKTYEIPLSAALATYTDVTSLYIRVAATLGGTTPSLTYGCFLTQ